MNKLMYTVILAAFAAKSLAIGVPELGATFSNDELPPGLQSLKLVKYDGPLYTLSPAELLELAEARENNASWIRPEGMPIIHLEAGTILDLGADATDGSSIEKRGKGFRSVAAYNTWQCRSNPLAAVQNFGCGTGCVVVPETAWSGSVYQAKGGRPYPTMEVWANSRCDGPSLQSMGTYGTQQSCTNMNCCGFRSFIAYFDCHH
ncbi:hypothetical protein NQ176_g4906 [Zarea fungicola]|uniref:Uncharacterized protein n=1 Tax=Zarea fungicola TaxID=93591 RepID=A0ACC1NCE4_9HYPO|nr:hypothetical protein NQ176_g4906 [Lecanicillium fungicola]